MDVATRHNLSGEKKAAILMMSLSSEACSSVLKHLSEAEIETLTLQMANLVSVSAEEKNHVIDSFYQRCLAQQGLRGGGLSFAREILEKALGPQKAQAILEKLTTSVQAPPMGFMREVDINQVAAVLSSEHPQTIAIVLANIGADQAAEVLSTMAPEMATDVAMRLAIMDSTSPDVIFGIERVLEKKLSGSISHTMAEETSGGVKALVDILTNVDRSTEKTILENFETSNPELADEVKKLMFVFEDIITLDDRSVQLVLQDVESKELALALKGTSNDVREKVMKNLSERAGSMLEEEIEYLGPVRLKQVEEAQQNVVAIIRKLEEAGSIVIARGSEDELVE